MSIFCTKRSEIKYEHVYVSLKVNAFFFRNENERYRETVRLTLKYHESGTIGMHLSVRTFILTRGTFGAIFHLYV